MYVRQIIVCLALSFWSALVCSVLQNPLSFFQIFDSECLSFLASSVTIRSLAFRPVISPLFALVLSVLSAVPYKRKFLCCFLDVLWFCVGPCHCSLVGVHVVVLLHVGCACVCVLVFGWVFVFFMCLVTLRPEKHDFLS